MFLRRFGGSAKGRGCYSRIQGYRRSIGHFHGAPRRARVRNHARGNGRYVRRRRQLVSAKTRRGLSTTHPMWSPSSGNKGYGAARHGHDGGECPISMYYNGSASYGLDAYHLAVASQGLTTRGGRHNGHASRGHVCGRLRGSGGSLLSQFSHIYANVYG